MDAPGRSSRGSAPRGRRDRQRGAPLWRHAALGHRRDVARCGSAGSALQSGELAPIADAVPVAVGVNNTLDACCPVADAASRMLYCGRLATRVEGVRQSDWGAPKQKGRPSA